MSLPAPTTRREGRARWRKLLERDLDLLVLDLLHTAPGFRERLIEHCGLQGKVADATEGFLDAWHSVANDDGRESDLEAEWVTGEGGRFLLLIEDKIGAAFTPHQPERYAARAAAFSAEEGQSASTLLIAPESYRTRYSAEVKLFRAHLPLEMLVAWCGEGIISSDRSDYVCGFLQHLMARQGVRGSVASSGGGGKPLFPSLHGTLREIIALEQPDLSITNSTDGEWVFFGFPGKAGVELRYRVRDHWAELVFKRGRIEENDLQVLLSRTPLAGADIAARGKSEVVVWKPTPEIDPGADGDEQRTELEGAVAVVAALASWYGRTLGQS